MNPFTIALYTYISTAPLSSLVSTMVEQGASNLNNTLARQEYADIVNSWPAGQVNVNPQVLINIAQVQQAIARGEYS